MSWKNHPLTVVANLCNEIRPAASGTYCLYVTHHKLALCRRDLAPKDVPIIALINGGGINTGLSKEMWNRIEARIRVFIKQGVIEWQPQKP